MMNCIVVDDEPLAQEILENFIERSAQLQLVKKCSNAPEAFEALHSMRVDVIFLDIKMPVINGLDFIRSLKDPPAVIFTTAFADHALAAFEMEAIDYLLKPITYERFEKCINKLLKIYKSETKEQKSYTYFKVSGQLLKINHTELLYAQSVKDYILLCTTNGNYLTHMTMKYLSELLPSPPFLRIHRSYLVNQAFVSLIDKSNITIGNKTIPVGENYRSNIEKIE
jgi:two-component system LytT family response regulator